MVVIFNPDMCSGGGEDVGRVRRSLAGDQGGGMGEDIDKLQQPPNITPIGGGPNLKVSTNNRVSEKGKQILLNLNIWEKSP